MIGADGYCKHGTHERAFRCLGCEMEAATLADNPVDDGVCPDCLPHSQCLACADCDAFHEARDNRYEPT